MCRKSVKFLPRPGYRKTSGADTNARSLSCAAKGEPKAKKEKAKNKDDKKKRAPSPYNCFVKAELGKVKPLPLSLVLSSPSLPQLSLRWAMRRFPHLAEARGVMEPAVQQRWHSCWRNTIWSTFLLVPHLRRILPINSRPAVRKAGALRLRSKWILTLLNTFSSPLKC